MTGLALGLFCLWWQTLKFGWLGIKATPPFWWFLLVILLYFKANKTTLKRSKEIHGDNSEVVSEVTKDCIKQVHSNGSQYQICYDNIKIGYTTQNYILLHSKANVIYTFSKNVFSVGNEEEFLKFLRNKGIKIK